MKIIFGLFWVLLLLGCEAITTFNQRPYIDVKLIGVWRGEYLEESGTLKRWIQTRNADGTYTIEFSFTEVNDTAKNFVESGEWWIQDGLFYEVALPEKEQLDKYRYSFETKECVSFVLVDSSALADGSNEYEFSECLVEDSPPVSIGGSI